MHVVMVGFWRLHAKLTDIIIFVAFEYFLLTMFNELVEIIIEIVTCGAFVSTLCLYIIHMNYRMPMKILPICASFIVLKNIYGNIFLYIFKSSFPFIVWNVAVLLFYFP